MAATARVQHGRLLKELNLISTQPPPGVVAWPEEDDVTNITAEIEGPPDSPYEGGHFRLRVTVPARYPFVPPNVRFETAVYHPNIDTSGRICLDTLKMPPKGAWVPSLNLSSVLSTVRLLLGNPNADDGLMPDITTMYKTDRARFLRIAREWTKRYATGKSRAAQPAATSARTSGSGAADDDSHVGAGGGVMPAASIGASSAGEPAGDASSSTASKPETGPGPPEPKSISDDDGGSASGTADDDDGSESDSDDDAPEW